MKRAKTKTTGTAMKATRNAAAKTKTSGTPLKSKSRPARKRPKAHGDPVLVDDGGSFRIGQRGTLLSGLKRSSPNAGDRAEGNFTDGAYLSVTNDVDGKGDELVRIRLAKKDTIRIKADGPGKPKVTLMVHPDTKPELDIASSKTASEQGAAESLRYVVPSTGVIVGVTRQTNGQPERPLFNKDDYSGVMHVSVVVSQAV